MRNVSGPGPLQDLTAQYGLHFPRDGDTGFLLHTESDGAPTCVAILPVPPCRWQVVLGCRGYILERATLVSCYEEAIGRSNIVSFFPGGSPDSSTQTLMGLRVSRSARRE